MKEDFKLKFYFNIYKDKPLSSRAEFRIRFKKLHGEFKRLEELIKNIENYQIKKYGTTLYDWNTNNEREEAFYLAIALSLDSLAVGFGSGLGYVNYAQVIILCFLVGIVCLRLGSQLGRHFANIINVNLSWLSGVLLIILAFIRTF